MKDAKSVVGYVFLLPANFEDGMTSHKQGMAVKTVLKCRPPKSLLSGRISSGWRVFQRLKLRSEEMLNVYLYSKLFEMTRTSFNKNIKYYFLDYLNESFR